ncbi:flagellar basal body-associated FliL family protein [Roseicyclus elongatus]|uniref:flagellar basal body-associated FliL family protein n=1 Tax=Roseicyclus elongatus TaxID=159346 RepID=UPI001FE1328B|nr:flagellar basal body-associated FliL family protein [Roseibacterium elongatum]
MTTGPFAPESPTTAPPSAAAADDADAQAQAPAAHRSGASAADVAFVPLDTIVITLGSEIGNRDLIFTAALEVAPEHEGAVTHLTPRVLDVLNGYLRVISLDEVNDPTSLARIRAQLLRRIQVVTGDDRVSDLLVTQFVVN